ncbi:DUF1492 domain-containing protein [Streptococcus sp. NLN64]|uniref:DUF1492 domain-containing protein n=1 Tax=Streptococcus sp. NLN64 TaxID=2822799 RepID=UPI0018C9354D|nr:DUF1492 domain-containing protein [Streptococcus sp. NLN64]
MSKKQTEAQILLHELRSIPKLIAILKQDIEFTRSSVLTSPKWSDMKVSGGVRTSQESKNIAIVDITAYNTEEIKKLVARRAEIIQIIMTVPDIVLRYVLLATYVNTETCDEAMEYLDIRNRNKYFTLKREAEESLDMILKGTTC